MTPKSSEWPSISLKELPLKYPFPTPYGGWAVLAEGREETLLHQSARVLSKRKTVEEKTLL
jgi:hypothetical protein